MSDYFKEKIRHSSSRASSRQSGETRSTRKLSGAVRRYTGKFNPRSLADRKNARELNSLQMINGTPRARFIGAARMARWVNDNLSSLQKLDKRDWDHFMDTGDLPPPFDFLNPPANWEERLRENGQLTGSPVQVTKQTKPKNADGSRAGISMQDSATGNWYRIAAPMATATGSFTFSQSFFHMFQPGFNPLRPKSQPYGWLADTTYNLGSYPKTLTPEEHRGVVGPNFSFWQDNDNPLLAPQLWQLTVGLNVPEAHPIEKAANLWLTPVVGPYATSDLARAALIALDPWVQEPKTHFTLPALEPLVVPARMIPHHNLMKQLVGTQVFIPSDAFDDHYGLQPGRVVVVKPDAGSGTPVTNFPDTTPPHPPTKGTKEKKVRVGQQMLAVAQKIFHGITEYGDAVDAIFEAIPKKDRCKTKTLVGKSACIATHLDKVDWGDAIVNLAWNQFEDWVIGTQLFARNKRAAAARGDPYGFRTLNSMSGFGGLEDLGELYGDFSKEYVNPSKQDLKDFLTRNFGL